MTYWYVPGMHYPYWSMLDVEDYPTPGETTRVAHNADADTDMGDLYGEEFFTYFPHAVLINADQYENQDVDPAAALAWSRLLRQAKKKL